MGDFNFDLRAINKDEKTKTQHEKKFNQMYKIIKNKLFSKDMTQLVKTNTREKQILDHIYTNKINKIKNIQIRDDSYSDHSILIITRAMQIKNVEETLINIRNTKNINYDELENKIFNLHQMHISLMSNTPCLIFFPSLDDSTLA